MKSPTVRSIRVVRAHLERQKRDCVCHGFGFTRVCWHAFRMIEITRNGQPAPPHIEKGPARSAATERIPCPKCFHIRRALEIVARLLA